MNFISSSSDNKHKSTEVRTKTAFEVIKAMQRREKQALNIIREGINVVFKSNENKNKNDDIKLLENGPWIVIKIIILIAIVIIILIVDIINYKTLWA